MTDRSLRQHTWDSRYRTGRNDVVADFYVPAYRAATLYCRAAGYFTSRSLTLMGRGLNAFTDHGGRIRLIASPKLELDDIIDIERGYQIREVFERAALRTIEAETDPVLLDGLGITGRLIAQGALDIKLAFLEAESGFGIYHEKIGYFRDENHDIVAFTGSSNETYGGLAANFESVDAYQSWNPGESTRVADLVRDFDDLWADATPKLHILEFPEVARERLEKLAQTRTDVFLPGTDDALVSPRHDHAPGGSLRLPIGVSARDYQQAAIRAWLGHAGHGILQMATGTGKTKTALMAASHVTRVHANRDEPLVVVIVAPYQHLVDQWIVEIEDFGATPIAIYESSRKWIPLAEDALAAIRLGSVSSVVMVATNASFSSEAFQGILARINAPLLLIGDEVHNLGAKRLAASLPGRATYRLGLSATPERYMDDAGTQRLIDYFGPVVFEMGLGEAIAMGALCHYKYYPRLVELDDDEMELYTTLTASIAALIAAGEDIDDADSDSPLGLLLRKRAGVLGHAAGKMSLLQEDLLRHRQDWYQLVYCAEGRRPDLDGSSDGPSQLQDAVDLIGTQLTIAAHTYVSETPRAERQALLRRFTTGDDLKCLIAMRCLDEGVDIPDARIAYILASSTNPRQFIQRRGRLLRQVPGEDKIAIIYDYLAVPQDREGAAVTEVERSLVRRELERAAEFAAQADNEADCMRVLRPIKERYGLMHL